MPDPTPTPLAPLAARSTLGGILMGLANLVPGISGGTMLLATGVYTNFITAIAEITTFRFRFRSLFTLACIVISAFAAIILLAGVLSHLVIHHRWIMYSIFIGLTLGGGPILVRMIRATPPDADAAASPPYPCLTPSVIMSILAGITVMVLLALVDPSGNAAAAADDGGRAYMLLFIAGIAGAAAMVLPGVSGAYLLLILGQYIVILTAVSQLKDGLRARDMSIIGESMHVVVPVGIGVIVGVVGISNLIRWLLKRYRRTTLGVLLGLLLGAVIGLWPFQQGVAPEPGTTFRGDTVTIHPDNPDLRIMATTQRDIDAADYPTRYFTPTIVQALSAAGLIAAGFLVAWSISKLGSDD